MGERDDADSESESDSESKSKWSDSRSRRMKIVGGGCFLGAPGMGMGTTRGDDSTDTGSILYVYK